MLLKKYNVLNNNIIGNCMYCILENLMGIKFDGLASQLLNKNCLLEYVWQSHTKMSSLNICDVHFGSNGQIVIPSNIQSSWP